MKKYVLEFKISSIIQNRPKVHTQLFDCI